MVSSKDWVQFGALEGIVTVVDFLVVLKDQILLLLKTEDVDLLFERKQVEVAAQGLVQGKALVPSA